MIAGRFIAGLSLVIGLSVSQLALGATVKKPVEAATNKSAVKDWTKSFESLKHNCDFQLDLNDDMSLIVPNQKNVVKTNVSGNESNYMATMQVKNTSAFGSRLDTITYGNNGERLVMQLGFGDTRFMKQLPKFAYTTMDGVRVSASPVAKTIKKGVYVYDLLPNGYSYRGDENGSTWYSSMIFDQNKRTITCMYGHRS